MFEYPNKHSRMRAHANDNRIVIVAMMHVCGNAKGLTVRLMGTGEVVILRRTFGRKLINFEKTGRTWKKDEITCCQ